MMRDIDQDTGGGFLSITPVEFLERLYPNSPVALTSILDGKVGTCNDRAKAEGWIAMANGHRNLYFNVNEARPSLIGRPSKEDIVAAHGAHLDVDPRKGAEIVSEQRRLLSLFHAFPIPAPVIIFSGGGYNAIWPFKEPVRLDGPESVERVELVNRKLERWFGSKDGCFNIDRLLRLPGTLNVLNETKRKEGRQPAMSAVVKADWDVRYSLEELEAWPALPVLAKWWLGPLLLTGQSPDREEPYESRSEAVWAAACELVRSGAADEESTEILLDRRLAISAHIYAQGQPERYAEKQIKKAHKEVKESATRGRPSHSDLLMKIGSEAKLFRTPIKEAYAAWDMDGHRECAPVDSPAFATYLRTEFRRRMNGSLPMSEAMKSALLALADDARRGEEHRVFLRVAGLGSRIYLDMGDDSWRAIEIDEAGWRVVSQPSVFFRRESGMRPLPEPVGGGKIGDIRQFLNLSSKDDLYLTMGFLLGCVQPDSDGPYVVLEIYGEHGTAKSTFARRLVALVDPKIPLLLGRPKTKLDLAINARESFMLAYNNLSHITEDLSDGLCQISDKEGGDAPRRLYTQSSIVFNDHRPVILNGIPDVVTRPDLADRSIKIRLEPIAEDQYRSDDALNAEYELAKPALLGALLSMVSAGLRNVRSMPDLKVSTRMASFTRWVAACGLGSFDQRFLKAYVENRLEAGRQMLAADPVATAVIDMMNRGITFQGSASQLLNDLEGCAGYAFGMRPKGWPKLPQNLSSSLRRLAPLLRKEGIEIELDVRIDRDNGRGIRIYRV
jgi:hypothetical protein